MQATSLFAATAALFTVGLMGCQTPAVGAPCLPEQVPDDGFDPSEAYIETSSVQCETRVCMVYQLEGAPKGSASCVPPESCKKCDAGDMKCVADVRCAADEQVAKRVYCTCRCDSGGGGFAECDCPSGFTCAQVLEQGNAGVRGKYCVRDGTISM